MTIDLGSRRRFLRDLGIGGAATVGAVALAGSLVPTAAGAQSTGGSGGAELPPADLATLAFLEGVELAAADAFRQAIDRRLLASAPAEACRVYEHHHREHAAALVEATGRLADEGGGANAAVAAEVSAQLRAAGTAEAVIEALAAFEERVAATGQAALVVIASVAAARPVGRITAVDAQQATVLGQMAGAPLAEVLPVTQPIAGAFTPSANAA